MTLNILYVIITLLVSGTLTEFINMALFFSSNFMANDWAEKLFKGFCYILEKSSSLNLLFSFPLNSHLDYIGETRHFS